MSWISIPPDSDFTINNLPWGVFSYKVSIDREGPWPRCCVAIGDNVVDLYALHSLGLLGCLSFDTSIFGNSTLNAFMSLDKPYWQSTRRRLYQLLASNEHDINVDSSLRYNDEFRRMAIISMNDVMMHLPANIGDYTDFYSSREHATNVGIMFRGKDNALQPNWLHLPVGYHSRSSSVVISGTEIIRPKGQLQLDKDNPISGSRYGPTNQLDFELEMAFFIGGATNSLGKPISINEAEDRIFGLVLLNDWSARDIQAWEYVPLGPFTAKNFATSISPWIVSLDALEPFRCETSNGPIQSNPEPLPYLQDLKYSISAYDINLQVALQTDDSIETSVITLSNFKYLYWNMKQQLVHHSVTGCPLRPGDLLGSGTISGPIDGSFGSMLELSWRGTKDINLKNGISRKFLKDGDRVIMKGWAEKNGIRVGFGEVGGKILHSEHIVESVEPSSITRSNACGYSDFKLYSYWRSSCSWRVRLALNLKGIEYEYIPIDIQSSSASPGQFVQLNDMEQLPVLEFKLPDGNIGKLTQSLAIIEFLDEACPSLTFENLLPKNMMLKAKVKEIAEIVNSGIQPLQNLRILKHVENAFVIDTIERGLSAIEHKLSSPDYNIKSGKYALGTSYPTLADICIIPQLENARRFGIDVTKYATLSALDSFVSMNQCFIAAAPTSCPDAR